MYRKYLALKNKFDSRLPSAFSFLISTLLVTSSASGFVFVSGSNEATLPVTLAGPTAKFYWDGDAPELKGVEDFAGGQFEGLSDEEVMEQLLLAAFDLWNKVPGSYVKLQLETDPNAAADSDDGLNSISIAEIGSQSTAAFAIPIIKNNTVIADCDISIAARSRTARTLAYTIAHEMGHCLGLGHAHTNYGSMMGYSRDTFNLKLGADDIAGLIYLYPDPNYVTEDPRELACGSISSGLTGKTSPITFQLLMLLLLTIPLILVSGNMRAKPVRTRP